MKRKEAMSLATYLSEFYEPQSRAGIALSVSECGWQSCGAGHSYGPVKRDYYVIHFVVRGRGVYRVGDCSFEVGRGQGFVVLAGDSTSYQADREDPWEYYWVGFRGNEAAHLLRLSGIDREHLVFSGEDAEQLERHIADIYRASADYSSREYAMVGYLYLFFSCMIRQTAAARGHREQYLDQAVRYIQEHCAAPFTVEALAAHVGIDRTYLYRIFKESFDLSVKEYIDLCRISRARDLLESTDLPVGEIAQRVGMGDAGRFSAKFKEICGVSPKTYRSSSRPSKNSP